ncbi:MAG: NUDIX hydrolase [Gloeomargarita sp. SKYBB_i_bin120]|nr:NUDIX hydrolase [Gloeomargarita sp. SKYG98]MCS7291357.1 NUDIX hydrolase [Gloeomargarita sp. SKYB120]MDW8176916.1 NUDIX hydrolase [Gloeomargarita sp. SKYBB_i_bin120]
MRNDPPELLAKRLWYQGRKFRYEVNRLRLPNGVEGEWDCVRHPGGAMAVPVTPEGQLVLVHQYRFTAQGRLLEFPAGTVENGEDPLQTIQRELQEETGYCAHTWQALGEFFLAPGYSDEVIYAYLATDLAPLARQPAPEADEDIQVVLLTPAQLAAAIDQGAGVDAKTIAGFFLARRYLQKFEN